MTAGGEGPRAGGSGHAEPAWLADVRLRVARRARWLRALWAETSHRAEDAMAISHSEVDRTLQPAAGLAAAERQFYRDDTVAAGLTDAIDRLTGSAGDPRWDHLVATLGLTPRDANLLALALAADAIPGMRRVFGYLRDDTVPADASAALAAELWDWASDYPIGTSPVLARWELARPAADARHGASADPGWVADPLILAQLTGDHPAAVPGLIGRDVELAGQPVIYPAELDEMAGFASAVLGAGRAAACVEIELAGAPGSGKTVLAAQAAAKLGERLVSVDAAALAALPDPGPAAVRELRQARLNGKVLAWQHADQLPAAARGAIDGMAPLSFLETSAETAAD